jgi:hypothetical protein
MINWYFVWRSEDPKRLAYEVLNKSRLVNGIYSAYALSAGHRLKDPNVTLIRIGNVGRQPIVAEDFRGIPIRISFKPARILARRHTDNQNPDISLIWSTDIGSTYASVTPELLNPREWFELQFRTDGSIVEPKISARLTGETHKISDVRNIERRSSRVLSILAVTLLFGSILGGWNPFGDGTNPNTVRELVGALCIGALLVSWAISMVRSQRGIWKKSETEAEERSALPILGRRNGRLRWPSRAVRGRDWVRDRLS